MKLVTRNAWIVGLFALALAESVAVGAGRLVLGREGSELGNSFIPFDSKIGDYSLEYSKKWRLTDLSQTTSFTDSEPTAADKASFLSVHADRSGGPATVQELRERLVRSHPDLAWAPVSFAGVSGLKAERAGVTYLQLLRAPRDLLSLRFRSSEGERTDAVIGHMLESFRAE